MTVLAALDGTAVIVALIGLAAAFVVAGSPWLLARQSFRRQDEVAEKLLEAQEDAKRRTDEVAETAARTNSTADRKIDSLTADVAGVSKDVKVVHGLVNSNLSAAKESELVALKKQRVTLAEMQELRASLDLAPSTEIEESLVELDQRIQVLQQEVNDRAEQTAAAAAAGDDAAVRSSS